MHGTITSVAEVTHVSKNGFWVLLDAEELLVPFEHFPWFKKATIEQLSDVEWPTLNHLYWPQLDADLSVESIRDPLAFPLISKRNEGQIPINPLTSLHQNQPRKA